MTEEYKLLKIKEVEKRFIKRCEEDKKHENSKRSTGSKYSNL